MTTTIKRSAKARAGKKDLLLPPSADVVKISGREYIIAPLDEFREWEEERSFAALMAERLEEDGSYISMEEFEKRLGQKKRAGRNDLCHSDCC